MNWSVVKMKSKLLSIFLILSIIFSSLGTMFTSAVKSIPVRYRDFEKYPQILESYYKRTFGQELNLENPKTYSEKAQWLKLYDSTPLKTKLADKYLVKDWIKEKVGEKNCPINLF